MKRITTLLMTAGGLALAACSGEGDGSQNVSGNTAEENAVGNVMVDEASSLGNVSPAAQPPAEDAKGNSVAAQPAAPAAPAPAARRPNPAPKVAPAVPPAAPRPATSRPAPRPEPSPSPKAECLPEHRAAGHC
jgi:hypothetical protein